MQAEPAPPPARLIHGEGTPEARWQAWPALARVPVRPLSWWVPTGTRLVVLAPHPDDEVLACGALLHQQMQAGGECLVIAATDGEASHPPTPVRSAIELAKLRRAESAEGLNHLGVGDHSVIRLGLPDGQVQPYTGLLAKALARLLHDTDRVVTTCQWDGHPDHEACAQAASEVCRDVGAHLLQAPVWLWHWAQPGEASVPWQRLRGFKASPASRHHKQQALAAHVSQTLPSADGTLPVVGHGLVQRARRSLEYFFV